MFQAKRVDEGMSVLLPNNWILKRFVTFIFWRSSTFNRWRPIASLKNIFKIYFFKSNFLIFFLYIELTSNMKLSIILKIASQHNKIEKYLIHCSLNCNFLIYTTLKPWKYLNWKVEPIECYRKPRIVKIKGCSNLKIKRIFFNGNFS